LISIAGQFKVEHYNKAGELLRKLTCHNKITDAAKVDILDVMLGVNALAATGWWVGLIDGSWDDFQNGSPDPITSNEFEDYDELTRQAIDTQFSAATTSAGYATISNTIASSPVTFTISTGVSAQALDGIFLIDTDTKGGAAGSYIWCTAAFGNNDASPAPLTVSAGDTVKVAYECKVAL